MSGTERRIEGWKSIAAYLGRDRSTVMRWARERDLPVHALPGGRTRSVYALARELDGWTGLAAPADPAVSPDAAASAALPPPDAAAGDPPAPPPATRATPVPDGTTPPPLPGTTTPPAVRAADASAARPAPRRAGWRTLLPRHRWTAALAGIVMLVVLGAASFSVIAALRTPGSFDPVSLARYVQARDDLATRTAGRLGGAIATLTELARRYPAHAGTHEALAEAWLLAREFGSAPDTVAFGHAVAEAQRTRALQPGSAVADRVEAVVAYWWDRDAPRAGMLFRRAITRDPRDPLARLWYANILADNGEAAAARREFTEARLLAPGAPYLLADYGWGLWSLGDAAAGEAQMRDLAASHPELASVQDCLSVMALARGDLAGYARHLQRRAALRNEAELLAYSASVDHTLATGARAATYAVMLSRALAYAEGATRPDHAWAAFIASMAGDRAQLLSILRHARERGERWGSFGYVRRIRLRWAGDGAVERALDALKPGAVEPI